MVSSHVNNNTNNNNNNSSNADVYANVMQGKILLNGCQLPKIIWNQIKILIIYNRDGKPRKKTKDYTFHFDLFYLEFNNERDMLVTETLPKLQQYFLTKGIYVYFIDFHLNWDFDLSKNPYHILRYMKEIYDAYQTSTGLFLLTFVGNKYGHIALPIELSTIDFNNIKNSATDLGKGK
jgi:hypothetical protein